MNNKLASALDMKTQRSKVSQYKYNALILVASER